MSETDPTRNAPTPSSPVDGLTAPITPRARMSVLQRIIRLFRR